MTTQYIEINSGSNGFGMDYPNNATHTVQKISHNAGFFSCSTIALQDIIIYFRQHKGLPSLVDRTSQYAHYKHEPLQNLIPFFFAEREDEIPYNDWFELSHDKVELQFSDYRLLDFAAAKPFMDKFFTPSQHVFDIVKMYEEKYEIDYEHTIGVFYRGNDKARECAIAPYDAFIHKAVEIEFPILDFYMPDYFVLPDETEFLHAMQDFSQRVITPDELPHMPRQDNANPFKLPTAERAHYAARFLAAVIVMSKCKHLITHSGNCGMWAVLYRGDVDGVHQFRTDKWLY